MKLKSMKTLFPAFLAVMMLYSCNPQNGSNEPVAGQRTSSSYRIPGEEEINHAVQKCYQALNVEEGKDPDYQALREAFTPDAVFINFRFDTAVTVNLDDFIAGFRKAVETGRIKTFREEETFGKTEGFGKIAHRISAYSTYLNDPDSVHEKGVNSFQLIKLKDGWRINSVVWDVANTGQPIPGYYSLQGEQYDR